MIGINRQSATRGHGWGPLGAQMQFTFGKRMIHKNLAS